MTFLFVTGSACWLGSVALYVAWRRESRADHLHSVVKGGAGCRWFARGSRFHTRSSASDVTLPCTPPAHAGRRTVNPNHADS